MKKAFYYSSDITQMDENKTFDNFYVGNSNRAAYHEAQAVAENFGVKTNPLCIKIPSGHGRYHLLCSVVNRMREIDPECRIKVMSVNEIVEDYLEYSRKTKAFAPRTSGKTSSRDHLEEDSFAYCKFEERFDKLDCLVLTDLELTLCGKEATQGGILQILQHMLSESNAQKREYSGEKNRYPQIILLYEKNYELSMKGMEFFDVRLETLFKKVGSITVSEPELELKLSFIESKLEALELEMTKAAKMLIAKSFSEFAGIESILHQCEFNCRIERTREVKRSIVEALLEQRF